MSERACPITKKRCFECVCENKCQIAVPPAYVLAIQEFTPRQSNEDAPRKDLEQSIRRQICTT